jgi:DNA repair exonuclease SbcCD ATPase subunit
MNSKIARRASPEEEELARKREELALLQAELAERELYLESLKAELAAFEGLYMRRVGVLYAELDEWNARLAELKAEQDEAPESKAQAAEARAQAEESYSAAHGAAAEVQPFSPSQELKKLYREAAKRVHPDTAMDEADRMRRERIMKKVNAAYAAGDEDALRRILGELDVSPEAVTGAGIGADLVRVLRQLKQVRDRIAAIALEVANFAESEIAKLKAKADIAAIEGRDLLAEMAASVQGRMNVAKQRYEMALNGSEGE